MDKQQYDSLLKSLANQMLLQVRNDATLSSIDDIESELLTQQHALVKKKLKELSDDVSNKIPELAIYLLEFQY